MTSHQAAAQGGSGVQGAEGSARILIVDDEPNARSALGELLRDERYEVASAADGRSAKRWCSCPPGRNQAA